MKTKRPGSGRTKGSFSFITVTLKELKEKFADENQPIIISRKFGEGFFPHAVSKPAVNTTESIQGITPESKVACKVVDLED